MSLASIAMNQIVQMFIIIFIGVICFKTKVIDEITNKKLSNILLLLVNPLIIFVSYQQEFSTKLLNGLLTSILLAIITHTFGIFISKALLRGKNNPDVTIEQFSCIYSNCGFMGIPLINGIIGSEGVFYITAYLTVFNILIWTQGVIMMTGKQSVSSMIKTIVSPSIIATLLGFVFFVAKVHIPNTVFQSLDYVASMNTPFAMLIAGATIAQTNILKLFSKIRIYLVVFIKLALIPVVMLIIYSRFNIAESVLTTTIVAAACPTAASGTLFALRYNKNALYASEIFALTTLFSMITIPIIMALTELFL